MALVPDRGKRQKNNIEIAYFIGAWRFFLFLFLSAGAPQQVQHVEYTVVEL